MSGAEVSWCGRIRQALYSEKAASQAAIISCIEVLLAMPIEESGNGFYSLDHFRGSSLGQILHSLFAEQAVEIGRSLFQAIKLASGPGFSTTQVDLADKLIEIKNRISALNLYSGRKGSQQKQFRDYWWCQSEFLRSCQGDSSKHGATARCFSRSKHFWPRMCSGVQ